ncbi:hypothetical protein [Streptococcus infantis]|uniref:hypothetical protein n=1 Tax=Streptococcus infantis TaxID=68892 RepID=UPI0039C48617
MNLKNETLVKEGLDNLKDEQKIQSSDILYSMKIKEQTRKRAAGCSKQRFKVVDRTDEVSSKYCFEVADGS